MAAGKGASVEPGDVVAGKYRVERVIGRGAMGLVLAAVDLQLRKGIALKCLLPHAWGHAAAIARFEREARAAGVLESEHVCRVLDVGRMPDGAPFIAMELLDGVDLAQELHRRGGRLPIPEAVGHVIEACDGIAEAHARGIIHRDLKPSNLFLATRAHREPIIKVLDFGISKPTAAEQSPSALTGTADLLGSPLYMSPEQLRTPKGVDARADQWSLAATLYELICGKAPFDGRTIADLAGNIMNAPAPDIRRTVPNAPSGLAETIGRALAKSRDGRFASVTDFARALAPFAPAKKTAALPAIPAAAPPAPISSTKMLTAPFTPREANRTLPLVGPSAVPPAPSVLPSVLPSAPGSNPSLVGDAGEETAAPSPPVHSMSGPLGLFGAAVMAVTVIVVVVLMRANDDAKPSAPAASGSATASASASPSASASAPSPAASTSADLPSPATSASVALIETDGAAILPASSTTTTAPPTAPPPRPTSSAKFPDANDPGY